MYYNQVGPREATKRLIDLIETGVVDARDVLMASLNWMEDYDVEKMAEANMFFVDYDDEDEDEDEEDEE